MFFMLLRRNENINPSHHGSDEYSNLEPSDRSF